MALALPPDFKSQKESDHQLSEEMSIRIVQGLLGSKALIHRCLYPIWYKHPGEGRHIGHVLSCRRKPEYPEETYADTERTCKLHIERPRAALESNPGPSCYEARR
ncbi:hypothetical protein WMY93_032528 [Mugilogobius chulae]|uniref:Uncharacterized protein n=1 Tax=Mugilogobius chulae TaxID=88201 RepID=A0AAW0MW39_9GOBI